MAADDGSCKVQLEQHSVQDSSPSEDTSWTSADDVPLNWRQSQKVIIIGLVSFSTFNDAIASTIFAPVVSQVLDEFHRGGDAALSSLLISVHVIGFVAGPLLLSPLSELYGRCPLMHASNGMFVVSAILCATTVDIPMIMVARVLMGLAGCVPTTLGGGVIADMMPVEQRGMAMSLWASGLLLGNVVGPIIGGYMAMRVGWRWTFWLEVIVSGCSTVVCLFFMRETYGPVLRRRSAALGGGDKHHLGQIFWRAISRPSRMITQTPIVVLSSMYNSTAYVYMYYLITTFPRLFAQRDGFNPGEVGLTYIGQGVGFCIAQFTVGPLSDCYIRRKKALHGNAKPEDRLPPLLVGCCLLGIGMIWYGWTAQADVHWIVPIIATGFAGLGVVYLFVSVELFLVDAYPMYAASAIAANVVVRSILGALLPLAGPALYNHLGYGWGNTLLGFIVLGLAPTTLLLYRFGEKIRMYPRFQIEL